MFGAETEIPARSCEVNMLRKVLTYSFSLLALTIAVPSCQADIPVCTPNTLAFYDTQLLQGCAFPPVGFWVGNFSSPQTSDPSKFDVYPYDAFHWNGWVDVPYITMKVISQGVLLDNNNPSFDFDSTGIFASASIGILFCGSGSATAEATVSGLELMTSVSSGGGCQTSTLSTYFDEVNAVSVESMASLTSGSGTLQYWVVLNPEPPSMVLFGSWVAGVLALRSRCRAARR